MAISIRVIHHGKDIVVAACDADLLGKTLSHNGIKFYVQPDFYGGQIVSVEQAILEVRRGTNVNLVGEEIVNRAIDVGLVHSKAVISLSGVPHALIVKI